MFTTLMPHLADRATAETCLVLERCLVRYIDSSPHPALGRGPLHVPRAVSLAC